VTSQSQSLSFGAKSAHASTGCTNGVVLKDAQGAVTATIAGGTDNLGFALSVSAVLPPGNHNEALLEA
jgi:ribosomal protein S6E (S10)